MFQYDFKQMAKKVLMDEEEFMELIDIYLIDYKAKRNNFFEYKLNNDIGKIIYLAHSFKGSAYSVYLTELGDAFYEIELSAKQQNIEKLEERILNIDKLIENLTQQIC